MQVKRFHFVLGIGLSVLFSSCYYNKRLIYLQDKKLSEGKTTLISNNKSRYKLQPFDVVSIQIKSSGQSDISTPFNITSAQGTMFASPGNLYLDGYSIDVNGIINLPIIGEVKVKEMTIEETRELIQLKAEKYLTHPVVTVKLTSFKVTILGEVKSPGYYYVYNNQVTALEALGLAGDITPFGNRKNIKLIRQTPEGTNVILLDLTKSDLLSSEFYFLMPGDVMYVEPFKARAKRENLDLLTLAFSALTTAVLILSYVQDQ